MLAAKDLMFNRANEMPQTVSLLIIPETVNWVLDNPVR